MSQRKSKVAGTFFPGTKGELATTLHGLLEKTAGLQTALPSAPAAVISPHAGYDYSGALTAAAWSLTARIRPDRIAILSPSHKVAFDGIAVPQNHRAVSLPGLRVKLATEAAASLVGAGLVQYRDEAFEIEHGIDTQLPFAARLHPKATVLPVVTGRTTPSEVAKVVDAIAALKGDTLVVLSSDLSHFLTHDAAMKHDLRTAGLIELGRGGDLTGENACGHLAIAGYLASNAGRACRALRVGRTTSFQTTGDADRVVGYGAWGLFAPDQDILSTPLRASLLKLAREALTSRLAKGAMPEIRVDSFAQPLRTAMASFVTLEKDGDLRGCIGSMQAHRPLVQDVLINAVKAGFEDPRFAPLTEAELDQITIKLSLLTRPAPVDATSEEAVIAGLVAGQTGVILEDGPHRATFLPSVWSTVPDPAEFLRRLKVKAGLKPEYWSDTMQIKTYRAEYFGEPPRRASEHAA